ASERAVDDLSRALALLAEDGGR
ncbi:TetR family transcriptional regulator, partial [Clavibacter michiganensis subsp. michiganensis]|nr:TetR family transcriptional regulator [Clavibacter michiganensis subsp. michiganensis]